MAALVVPFLAVLLAFGAALYANREWLNETGEGHSLLERRLLPRLARWVQKRAPADRDLVLVFGDSLNVCGDPGGGQELVSRALRRETQRSGREIELLDLTHVGLRPIQFYALLGDVLEQRPRAVLVEINVRAFQADGPVAAGIRLPHLARKIGFADALRLREPLATDGLTVLDPALLRLKQRFGVLHAIEGLRQAFFDWLDGASRAATSTLGLDFVRSREMVEFAQRQQPPGEVDYASHANVEVLRALRDAARANGARILFYVAPVNPEALAAAAPGVARSLPRRLEALRRAAGAAPDEWLDLHDRVPASLFRDTSGHLRLAGCPLVAEPLAERLLRVLGS